MESIKILVVDDDAKIRKVIRHCLEKEGFEVSCAVDGEDALKVALVFQPDLIVLDLMMPKIDGLEVARRLTKSVPIIILSAKGEAMDRITGFRIGVDDYLAKPFSPVELVLRVKAVLRRVYSGSSKAGGKPLEYDGLYINPKTREVLVNSAPVSLTGKEFELLLLLASSPHQAFSRHELLKRVWHTEYEGDDTTLTVHIRRIREKIEKNPSAPKHIQTVWGIGYKFEP